MYLFCVVDAHGRNVPVTTWCLWLGWRPNWGKPVKLYDCRCICVLVSSLRTDSPVLLQNQWSKVPCEPMSLHTGRACGVWNPYVLTRSGRFFFRLLRTGTFYLVYWEMLEWFYRSSGTGCSQLFAAIRNEIWPCIFWKLSCRKPQLCNCANKRELNWIQTLALNWQYM